MSQLSEINRDDLYSIFQTLGKIKEDILSGKHSSAYSLAHILDEVLKLKADVEKLKAHQSEQKISS